jgi:hypothetical protein
MVNQQRFCYAMACQRYRAICQAQNQSQTYSSKIQILILGGPAAESRALLWKGPFFAFYPPKRLIVERLCLCDACYRS